MKMTYRFFASRQALLLAGTLGTPRMAVPAFGSNTGARRSALPPGDSGPATLMGAGASHR